MGMRSTRSWSWKSPLDRRLRSRMATRPFQFMGMDERNTPKSELFRRPILTSQTSKKQHFRLDLEESSCSTTLIRCAPVKRSPRLEL